MHGSKGWVSQRTRSGDIGRTHHGIKVLTSSADFFRYQITSHPRSTNPLSLKPPPLLLLLLPLPLPPIHPSSTPLILRSLRLGIIPLSRLGSRPLAPWMSRAYSAQHRLPRLFFYFQYGIRSPFPPRLGVTRTGPCLSQTPPSPVGVSRPASSPPLVHKPV